jgi:AcrR family transcriptional regulator
LTVSVRSGAVPETSLRDRKAKETRARIADAALELFARQGYVDTTIDQIAEASGVGRRTVFRYFATKQAILFDHLVVRREDAIERLRERPLSEPPLVSLHAVLREHCERGFDRQLLTQIRVVLATDPRLASEELSAGSQAFERQLFETMLERLGDRTTFLEAHALTVMACSWVLAAVRIFFVERRRSLVKTFDEVVATCVQAGAHDLA